MASQHLIRPFGAAATTHRNSNSLLSTPSVISLSTLPQLHRLQGRSTTLLAVRAKGKKQETTAPQSDGGGKNPQNRKQEVEEEIEVEEDLPWIQEKALDLVEFSGTVTQAIPGPRVGQSPLPWLLAIPLAYVGLSFVIAVVKTVRKFTSPREKRKKLVNKNAMLCKSIDELFQRGGDALQHSALKGLMQKTDFGMDEILRKYIRYALNEKPFNHELVADLILLRKASMLEDSQVAEVLNEVSRRIVKEKDAGSIIGELQYGLLSRISWAALEVCSTFNANLSGPVIMDISGFTEKGAKRKLAVQALCGKMLYLSVVPDFCSADGSLIIKEIFGVTDEDADILRDRTLPAGSDVNSLQRLVDSPDSEEESDASNAEKAN